MRMSIKKDPSVSDLQKLKNHLKKITEGSLKVGYFEDSGEHESAKVPYSVLMMWHEYGLGNYPMRPALQLTGDLFISGKDVVTSGLLRKFLTQIDNYSANLDRVGEYVVNSARSDVFGNPSILASNHADKGSNTPLVETTELRENLGFKTSYEEALKK